MKKFWLVLFFLLPLIPGLVSAQSMVSDKKSSRRVYLKLTSFPEYYPFSFTEKQGQTKELQTVFTDGINLFAKTGDYQLTYEAITDYDKAVADVRRGEIDILLGMYYDTKLYAGLEYLYPAAMNNPVHVAMLPQNISKVAAVEDLKSLRGLYIEKEYFSDYMINNFKRYNIKPVENAFKAYEQLFTGQADYVVGSYYHNYAEVCRLGLKDYVAFSKNPLWNMPLFIGVSKASRSHNRLNVLLKRFMATEPFKQSIGESLKRFLRDMEIQTQGVVPPKFVRAESLSEQTPADEMAKNITAPNPETGISPLAGNEANN